MFNVFFLLIGFRLWPISSFLFIHELDIGLNELIGLIDCRPVHGLSPLVLPFGLFLVECDLFDVVNGMVCFYTDPSPLLRVVWHFQFLNLTAQDRVGHRLQTIQFFDNFFSWCIFYAEASLWFAGEVFLFIGSLAGSGIECKGGWLIGRFGLAVCDTWQRSLAELVIYNLVDDVLETLMENRLLLRPTLHR
jgi:hypothetical protein